MSDETSIGIDTRDEQLLVARISHSAGRPVIDQLQQVTVEADPTQESFAGSRRMFAISERDAIIKHIYVGADETYAASQRARLELVQSLLEPEQNFAIDILPSHSSERFIGVAIRKSELNAYQKNSQNGSFGFQARGVALAKGFRAFCEQGHGDFHCVLDVAKDGISIVFLYQGLPARIGYMPRPDQENTETAYKTLAGDLKTALSFHINTLFHEGITVPLSQIHISVDNADNELLAAMRQYSHVELQPPVLNQFTVGPNVTAELETQHRFLTALGLALE